MEPMRQVDLAWRGKEVEDYEMINRQSQENKKSIQEYIKELLRKYGI